MQKVKVSAGYSDKISENYNSKQYSIALEMELQINGNTADVELASSKLFALCRKIVSAQKEVSIDGLLNQNAAAPVANSVPNPSDGKNGGLNNKPITAKQVAYIFRLGHKAGLSDEQVRQLPMQYFGKPNPDLNSLSSGEASRIIETLSETKKAA